MQLLTHIAGLYTYGGSTWRIRRRGRFQQVKLAYNSLHFGNLQYIQSIICNFKYNLHYIYNVYVMHIQCICNFPHIIYLISRFPLGHLLDFPISLSRFPDFPWVSFAISRFPLVDFPISPGPLFQPISLDFPISPNLVGGSK